MRGLDRAVPLTAEDAAALFVPLVLPDRPVVLAVSGGPDSVAMLGLYAEAMRLVPLPQPIVATVDHGLRPGSAAEAAAVGRFATALGAAHHVLTWTERTRASHLQEDARAARYRLLSDLVVATGSGAVLTAHTLDDQAETVLMRLIRGSGPAGLQGILATRTLGRLTVIRPLLGVAKARLIATCAQRGWDFVTDPSNADLRFDRARLRGMMPVLAREGLTAERLARLAARMQRMQGALDQRAGQVRQDIVVMVRGRRTYDATVLCREPDDVVLTVLRQLIEEVQGAGAGWQPLRLSRLEALTERFIAHAGGPGPFSATLGEVALKVRGGLLSITPAPPRRAGD